MAGRRCTAVRRIPADLKSVPFPSLSWAPEDRTKSLSALVGYATSEAERAIDWYYWKRRRMQRWGRGLRLGAVLATSAAGVTPLLAELMERERSIRSIEPLWAALLLAVAGILVLLDRFWGCTSAWVRYMRAAQEISAALDALPHPDGRATSFSAAWSSTWTSSKRRRRSTPASAFLGPRAVGRAAPETDAWATEFHKVLEQIEDASQRESAASDVQL